MPPVFGALTKQYKSVHSDTVDVFRHPDAAERYGVRAIPTILLTRAGCEIVRFEGPVAERTLVYHLNGCPEITPARTRTRRANIRMSTFRLDWAASVVFFPGAR